MLKKFIIEMLEDFGKLSRFRIFLLCLLLVLALGNIDWATGYELSFAIFYLVPIALTAWFVGQESMCFIALTSTIVWLWADLISGHSYSNPLIPSWNASMRLLIFLVIGFSFVKIKSLWQSEKDLARTDYLTGVHNSRYFYELIDMELGRARRFKRPLALAYLDIDDFKKVNDTLSHQEGDRILAQVARTLHKHVRSTDVVARIGGDEFVILFSETSAEQVRVPVERMLEQLKALAQQGGSGISFSIGVVNVQDIPNSAAPIIRKADQLMYAAKEQGKNLVKYGTLS